MNALYIILALLFINGLEFALYGLDKRAARNGSWRIPESSLLLLAFLGGSPAAFIASKYFRHKSSKSTFIVRFWLVILLQVTALVFYLLFNYV